MITWLGFRHVKYGVRPHHIPIMGQVSGREQRPEETMEGRQPPALPYSPTLSLPYSISLSPFHIILDV